ncbi:MAG: glutathione synthase [Deltaproteobacteria bacterium]|nr:glutathione synthase [Deltaproteobacteria bacterium]
MRSARAVILPQGCRKSLYRMARATCPLVFPNYDKRFEYPDKIGQALLFRKYEAIHPETETFGSVADFRETYASYREFEKKRYPLVFKFDWGGEGHNVFLIKDARELQQMMSRAASYEKTGQYGFLLQEFIPSRGRSLRVVVIDTLTKTYWRRHGNPDAFYTNLSKGAVLETDSAPLLQEAGKKAVIAFSQRTGIDLAGFDLLFSEKSLARGLIEPLFLEINYFFGRKGLGGSDAYYKLLQREIDRWIDVHVRR